MLKSPLTEIHFHEPAHVEQKQILHLHNEHDVKVCANVRTSTPNLRLLHGQRYFYLLPHQSINITIAWFPGLPTHRGHSVTIKTVLVVQKLQAKTDEMPKPQLTAEQYFKHAQEKRHQTRTQWFTVNLCHPDNVKVKPAAPTTQGEDLETAREQKAKPRTPTTARQPGVHSNKSDLTTARPKRMQYDKQMPATKKKSWLKRLIHTESGSSLNKGKHAKPSAHPHHNKKALFGGWKLEEEEDTQSKSDTMTTSTSSDDDVAPVTATARPPKKQRERTKARK